MPDPQEPDAENPWYLRPFFGRKPALPSEARSVLLLVSLGLFFENYDLGLINAALPQIVDELGIDPSETGYYLGVIRLGGVGTFLIVPFADRLGRRRVFIASFLGMSVGTLLSGIAQTPMQFVLAQMFARVWLLTAAALALVIVVEEFPAEHRGAGLGLLTLLGGLGYGVCAIAYSAVDALPHGWRTLYVVGILPVLLLPFFSRALKETRRFQGSEQARADTPGFLTGWLQPIVSLARTHPRRTATIGLAAFLSATGGIGLFQYTSEFVQKIHGWTPADYSGLVIAGGAIGIMGSVLGGRGSDRFGRRYIGMAGLIFAPLFAVAFFLGPTATLIVSWGLFVFCNSAGELVIRAMSAELFPTSHRGTSTGWMMLVQTLGWATGLFLIGFLTETAEDIGPSIASVSVVLIFAGLALLAVPETGGRELESISDES
jgi:putative MFS transporter